MYEQTPKGQKWDWQQTNILIENYKKGKSIRELTEILNEYLKEQPGSVRPERSYDSVAHKLKNLGLISEQKLDDTLAAKKVVKNFNRLNNYEEIKGQVFCRDKKKCVICGTKDLLQLAHVIPFRNTSSNNPEELVTLCKTDHELFDRLNEFETKKIFDYMCKVYPGYEKKYKITYRFNQATNKDMAEIKRID